MTKSIFLIIFFAIIFNCVELSNEDNFRAVYSSEHLIIHYNPVDYTIAEVENFAIRKEKLIDYLDSVLKTNYDTVINTYLYTNLNNTGTTTAYYQHKYISTHESWFYLYDDSGHELAHAITFRMLGVTRSKAMSEGMATFLELKMNNVTSIEQFLNYHSASLESLKDLFSAGYDIEKFKYNEYHLCAAFIEFIYLQYGIEKIKTLWIRSCDATGDSFINSFLDIFNKSFDDLESEFIALIYSTSDSKPFDNGY